MAVVVVAVPVVVVHVPMMLCVVPTLQSPEAAQRVVQDDK